MSRSKETWIAATGGLPDRNFLRVTTHVPTPGRFAHGLKRAVILDTETDPIIRGQVPAPRIACTCDIKGRNRRTYRPNEFRGLAKDLGRASVVTTFNGDDFDFKVVAKHLKTSVRALAVISFDLMTALKRATKWPHSLMAAQPQQSGLRESEADEELLGRGRGTAVQNDGARLPIRRGATPALAAPVSRRKTESACFPADLHEKSLSPNAVRRPMPLPTAAHRV